MSLYQLADPGPLASPALVVAFEGWVNAGQAGTLAAATLAGEGKVIAGFDQDALFDYRANRPTVTFREGVLEEVAWPEVTLTHRRVGSRDLLVLSGAEPNWQWRRLGGEVAELARRLGVVEQLSLGGVPWATPHTRPVSIMVTASDAAHTDPGQHPEGLLRVPGSVVSIIEAAVMEVGIRTVGLWARVPQYVATAYPAAAAALVARACTLLGIDVDAAELLSEAAEQRVQLDAVVQARPEVKALVGQLELLADQEGSPAGDQLAAEIERFLREQGT